MQIIFLSLTHHSPPPPSRLTGYGIHHCFARSVLEDSTSHLHYYSLAGIAMASCVVLCPVVVGLGRRGGLLTFMIITALASLLQLGLLSCEYMYVYMYTCINAHTGIHISEYCELVTGIFFLFDSNWKVQSSP